jgi:phosphate starvation-inducible membrane PsiE
MKIHVDLRYLAVFFLEWQMFETNVVEKIKTHFMFFNFVPKIVPFMR